MAVNGYLVLARSGFVTGSSIRLGGAPGAGSGWAGVRWINPGSRKDAGDTDPEELTPVHPVAQSSPLAAAHTQLITVPNFTPRNIPIRAGLATNIFDNVTYTDQTARSPTVVVEIP